MTNKLNSVRFIWWHSASTHSLAVLFLSDSGEKRPVCSLGCILWPQKPGEAMSNGNCNESWLKLRGGRDVFNREERGNERDYMIAVATMWLEELNSQQKCATEGFFFFFFSIYLSCTDCMFVHFWDVRLSSSLGFECMMTPVWKYITLGMLQFRLLE